jgi:hypothetical protein
VCLPVRESFTDGGDGDGDRWRWLRGHFPILAGCRNRDFCPPKFVNGGGGATKLFWKFLTTPLGFSVPRLLIGEGASSGGARAPSHLGGVARAWAAPAWCVGPSWPYSASSSVLWKLPDKIRLQELVSSNSENISCVDFLKHKNSRKQGTDTVASCQ